MNKLAFLLVLLLATQVLCRELRRHHHPRERSKAVAVGQVASMLGGVDIVHEPQHREHARERIETDNRHDKSGTNQTIRKEGKLRMTEKTHDGDLISIEKENKEDEKMQNSYVSDETRRKLVRFPFLVYFNPEVGTRVG